MHSYRLKGSNTVAIQKEQLRQGTFSKEVAFVEGFFTGYDIVWTGPDFNRQTLATDVQPVLADYIMELIAADRMTEKVALKITRPNEIAKEEGGAFDSKVTVR